MVKKILLVDDEINIVKLVKSRLEANGYEVLTAYDGQEALDKVKEKKPDLIILDLSLPKIDGIDVFRTLSSDTNYNNIPVIMLTARGKMNERALGLKVGAAAYITKPFNPDILLGAIKGVVG